MKEDPKMTAVNRPTGQAPRGTSSEHIKLIDSLMYVKIRKEIHSWGTVKEYGNDNCTENEAHVKTKPLLTLGQQMFVPGR